MSERAFNDEQRTYLQGFMSGLKAATGDGTAATSAPKPLPSDDKLTAEEKAKREANPLDIYDRMTAAARDKRFPKGLDVFRWKYHGLFYVAPAEDAFMCRLRIPNGILTAHQCDGLADLAEDCGGGFVDVTTRANLQIRQIKAENGITVVERLADARAVVLNVVTTVHELGRERRKQLDLLRVRQPQRQARCLQDRATLCTDRDEPRAVVLLRPVRADPDRFPDDRHQTLPVPDLFVHNAAPVEQLRHELLLPRALRHMRAGSVATHATRPRPLHAGHSACGVRQ